MAFVLTRGSQRRLAAKVVVVFVLLAFFLGFHTPGKPTTSLSFSSSSDPQPPPPGRRVPYRKSEFDWAGVSQSHPVDEITPLPDGPPQPLRRVQHDFSHDAPHPEAESRRKAVRDVFVKSWESYKEHAWGRDELQPLTLKGRDTLGGWAATLVDSLDTLWIMGLDEEFAEASAFAVQINWDWTTETAANLFETTIRHLGGLLGAYDLSGESALLLKATELGDMLHMAFDTPNRIPGFWADFKQMGEGTQVAGVNDPSAAVGSLSVEFAHLSQLTGDPKYFDAVDRVARFFERTQGDSALPGMWPRTINFREERVDGDNGFTLGALADSLYEYLPKMHALLGGRDPSYEKMYRRAMDVVAEHHLFRPMVPDSRGGDVLFSGDAFVRRDGTVERVPEGQHLSCFAGGMFGLGGKLFGVDRHVDIGEKLARGCAWAYDAFPTGLMPEIFNLVPCPSLDGPCAWDEQLWRRQSDAGMPEGFKNARDPRYILRPEAIESVFLLYRMTGNQDLQDVAWRMFQSVMRATETKHANSAIADVNVTPEDTKKLDEMESFWTAETLKYYYLIFSPPDLISLDDFVFNTEAHPFRLGR